MHQARSAVTVLPVLYRNLFVAMAVAFGLATVAAVIVRADSQYNSNPPYCHNHAPFDFPYLWFWYECDKPDDPEWGKVY